MTDQANHYKTPPVIIVGGGPVGMGLAIDLAQRGIASAVIEKHPQPQPIPKGQNLTQRTMEHMRAWGVEDRIRAARPIPRGEGISGLTTYRTLLSEYTHDWLKRGLVRPYYAADNERLPQYATEDVLRARAAAFDCIDIRYGWRATAVAQDADGATVDIAEHHGQGRESLHGAFVVGCDGSKSVVREHSAITQSRSEHDKLMVLLVFRSQGLKRLLERYPGKSFFNVLHPDLQGYWLFFGRVDARESFFFHAPVPADTTRDNFDFAAYLHQAVGAEFDVDIEHIGFWDLRFAVADRYRDGRLFIAGDAAHSHPPYGGYGINTGFEDARNLGWRLAAVLDGVGSDETLDSYSRERQPVFRSTAEDFIAKAIASDRAFLNTYDPQIDRERFEAAWAARLTEASNEVGAFEPHYEGSPDVAGPDGAVSSALGRHAFTARAGHHLAPQRLATGEDIYDRLGADFTLVALGARDEHVEAFRQTADELGLALTLVCDRGEDAVANYGARLILARPDHFVAWTGDAAPADTGAVLRKAVGLEPDTASEQPRSHVRARRADQTGA
jgi:2-polyprenyl-6-methoxyphenol hydroxylase-like FAD-dependent oxidoreductase